MKGTLERREFLAGSLACMALCQQREQKSPPTRSASDHTQPAAPSDLESSKTFSLNYMLPSCMYGRMPLDRILPEVKKIGATAIDIWPAVHGNQREQIDEMGREAFVQMLNVHSVKLGCITQYPLGPFGLADEMRFARQLGCNMIVTGGSGPTGLKGSELKKAVATFVEKMKPHLEVAEQNDVTIALENHANNLVFSPDSLKWLVELRPSKKLAIALAPYHLPQDAEKIGRLIRDVAPGLALFYAWQYGAGCKEKLPKEKELLQMPGRGELDFAPLIEALAEIRFQGWTEIFMHPVPRGIPIHETADQVTVEINAAREYLAPLVAHQQQTHDKRHE